MSLTNPFGIKEREIKKIIKECCPDKNEFYSLDGEQCFNTKAECIVSSELNSTEANLCGTAFDYMARFLIAKKIKDNKEDVVKYLCAGNVFGGFGGYFYDIKCDNNALEKYGISVEETEVSICGSANFYLQKKLNLNKEKIESLICGGIIKLSRLKDEVVDSLELKYFDFLKPIQDFVLGLNDDEEKIIEKCIILAHLEQISRSCSGVKTVSNLFVFCDEYMNVRSELHKLLNSFKRTFLPLVKPDSEVIFNPGFGIGSRIVGGADSDVYIDGTLYDFKVIKKNGWSSTYATQIIGYYLLDLIAKKCEDHKSCLYNYKIDRVALYNVRYEKISYYDCGRLNDRMIDSIIHKVSDTYVLYKVFHFVRHYDEIIEKYKIPIKGNNCLDWNEQRAEELEYYRKVKEQGLSLTAYELEEFEFLSEIKNRIISYMETADTLSIIKDVLKKDYSN